MHRMGLVDFWFYVNEEFRFKDGHMLLRGSNGSGKSVTMQSFIPLILDGNKSSERLDSFGTKSRKIENYLIEEDGDRDDRIGYLYLEFKREDADIYKTIGIGLHARRNKPVDSWYFVIEDNRRINQEIQLMDHDLAITKQMLKNIIGTQLVDSQKEYMERVNNALFGFASLSDYKDAITLLIQLRSPKLSNSLKPTMINAILSNSLQPLSEDDLRPMSEAISNMDEIKDQLDALKQSYVAAKTLAGIYDQYNHAVLDYKALSSSEKTKNFLNIQSEIKDKQKAIEQCIMKQAESEQELVSLHMEQSVLNEEKTGLLKQDMKQLVEEIAMHKEDQKKQSDTLKLKEKVEEEKDNQRIDAKNKLNEQQNKKELIEQKIIEIFNEMNLLQESLQFEEHLALYNEVISHLKQPYDYSYTQQRMKDEMNFLHEGIQHFEKINSVKQQQKYYLDEHEALEMQKELKEKELEEYQSLFSELQDEYKEKFAIWNKNNQLLNLDNDQIIEIYQYIQRFESEDCYGEIDTIIHNIYFEKYQKQTRIKSELEISLKQLHANIERMNHEIREWTNMKDPSPEMDSFMLKNRALLDDNKIAFKPLYKLLDYKEDVPQALKNNFEEILCRSNLLNAILVHEHDKDKILSLQEGTADYYIFVKEKVENLNVFLITKKIAEECDLKQIFQAMCSGLQINGHDNYFDNGMYVGTISKQVETKFIGEVSRERYRMLKLEQLQIELETLQLEKNKTRQEMDAMVHEISQLEIEYHKYPDKADLNIAKQNIVQNEKDIEILIHRMQIMMLEIQKKDQEIAIEKAKITMIAKKLGIDTTHDVFVSRKEAFIEYEEYFYQIENQHSKYISAHEISTILELRNSDLINDVDTLRYEIKETKQLLEKLTMRIDQKEQQLSKLGYEDVKNRIDEIQNRLAVLPISISNIDQLVGKLKREISDTKDAVLKLNTDMERTQNEKDQAEQEYQEEIRLQYVVKDETQNKQADIIHRFIEKTYPNLKRKDTLANDVQTSFHTQRGVLQEYNLSMITLFEEKEETSRLDITARYQGMRITFFQLIENLQKDIEKQSALLEDSDRTLIEDILVNTISKKIRSHIQNSKRWVQVMNRYMDEMNTSSGLKLNLQWKSHKAENDEELNSEKLVELLEKDVKILKESDRKHLSSHFRSKITTARKVAEQQDTHESFHQVMKTVMDYRTWFDFRILSQKTGEKKKELTNNAFYAFSGGEKAMAMYIPLFSAVAAKFEGARDDAPLLITLDEAFAGVDEKNINNMFSLIGKFKFDYIMNSQVLWGDYPSVKALAIHELYRPENARFVTVISYEWNGHIKKMVERI